MVTYSLTERLKALEAGIQDTTSHYLRSKYNKTIAGVAATYRNPWYVSPEEKAKYEKEKLTTEYKTAYEEAKAANLKRYEEILEYIHRGAYAYSIGDYGTAINCFTRLLGIEWLKHATYFYLVKTLIKLDIEKELLLLRTRSNVNNTTKSNL